MMRIFERHRARYEFVRMNGVDPWAGEASAVSRFGAYLRKRVAAWWRQNARRDALAIVMGVAIGAAVTVSVGHAGFAHGVQQVEAGNALARMRQDAERAVVAREVRNQRLINFMIAEGRCPPIDMTCPVIRMTSR